MRFNIVAHKKWWFTLSSILVIFSVISIFINGFNFGIDYTGGTILDMQFNQPVTVAQVRDVVDQSNMDLGKQRHPAFRRQRPGFVPGCHDPHAQPVV